MALTMLGVPLCHAQKLGHRPGQGGTVSAHRSQAACSEGSSSALVQPDWDTNSAVAEPVAPDSQPPSLKLGHGGSERTGDRI